MENTGRLIDEKEWKKEFSDMLNKLLHDHEISINQLADKIDIDPKTIRNYINQKSVPTAVILMNIANHFNVSVDYLATGGKTKLTYSARTIREIATLIRNFNVKFDYDNNDNTNGHSISLKIEEPILTAIITELFMTPDDEFESHLEKIISSYGNMKALDRHLVDYATFQNLIKYRYVYGEFDDVCYTVGEYDRRREEWENMSLSERERWWADWLEEHEMIN